MKFSLKDNKFPYPFNQTNKTTFHQDIGFDVSTIPDYPMNFNYYKNKREYLIDLLNINQVEEIECSIVIHLRLDDIFSSQSMYTLLPFDFYRQVFKVMPPKDVCIIGKPINKEQMEIVDRTEALTKTYFSNVQVKVIGRTIEDDFKTIMGCEILIASTSSFWFWPAYLSRNVKEIHVPLFAQTYLMNIGVGDDYIKIINYTLPFNNKLTSNNYKHFLN